MNFLTMKQELADRLSAFDQTISDDDTRLGRWINMAQQELGGEWNWSFLWGQDIFTTVPDYTTGTVSITAGSTTGTLSVVPSVSFEDRYIQFAGEDEWYKITSHTASTTTLAIDPAYYGAADLSGATFVIRKVYYSLDSVFSGVLDVKISKDRAFLNPLQRLTSINLAALLDSTGKPSAYYLETPASNGAPLISFYPSPDAALNVFIRGKMSLTDMTATTDTSIVPVAYHNVIVDLASFYGFSKLNNALAATFFNKYSVGVQTMKSVYSQDLGRLRVMSAIDEDEPEGSVSYNLPEHVDAP